MAANTTGRGHEPTPTRNHGSDLQTSKVSWKKAYKSTSLFISVFWGFAKGEGRGKVLQPRERGI